MTLNWQPTATMGTLRERARLIATVRAFFAARGIWEVETPVLGQGGSTDVHLVSLSSLARTDKGQRKLWLQTSPEFHMKRLLAADSGPIFQLAKSFRDGEVGARHNIEFTMLEWYRPGFTLAQLIEETTALVEHVLPQSPGPVVYYRYRELFHRHLEVDPFTTSLVTLRSLAAERGNMSAQALAEEGRDTCLDLLMGMVIEPTLGQQELSVVVDYPASQAALARRHQDADGEWVASRFELYLNGIELANGYDELTDAEEQRQRFDADNAERRRLGLPEVDVDAHLLAALEQGLPASSGVALGLDRLIQLALGKTRLEEVLAFSTANC
ncbi:EF-P lysine aminoacylase EpmA [Vreelandella aquamarina]|jgi:lysyl-tRNA synthetase class 2|uniref:Lysyl-tRNA synthetase, class 2 n=1 Tax=Vreelandella aquamarina TaxID=77097 RepID=A0A1N6CQM5_9GAMM|nr:MULTISPECIES: EF-P lysine aminoacylase EpmA [Halomonas]MAD21508.1 EF-P lysine aminoacylase GenX [Halomonas sp.]MCC4287994.1 EF-P lysine aminoacylase GenX [Halomonas meridiana]SIN60881.1 lysyl-tRNA synthetase, class 2 [Halomonas meridiana]SIN65703.1 lysyl-tRNA synthetase, class 2 [Halomonas meridiana]SIO02240.1 lysyl-tRNA synthetase, class 2 [Halomonas meridiana]|tara:strand:+ start:1160 stop:2140 length:981 start_codon:yes stop_codon:yes gene_type:complete